jgi:hypothetical protein
VLSRRDGVGEFGLGVIAQMQALGLTAESVPVEERLFCQYVERGGQNQEVAIDVLGCAGGRQRDVLDDQIRE